MHKLQSRIALLFLALELAILTRILIPYHLATTQSFPHKRDSILPTGL